MEKLSVEIAQLPDQFHTLLAQSRAGHEIIVTEGGQARAVLTPVAGLSPTPPTNQREPVPTEPSETTEEMEVTVSFLGEPRIIRVPVSPPGPNHRVPGLGVGLIEDLTEFDEPLPDEFWFGESSNCYSTRTS